MKNCQDQVGAHRSTYSENKSIKMTDNIPVETEAELQARLEACIRAALPLLPAKINLERYLRLRLGHRVVVIDGLKPDRNDASGRYDILVIVAGKPLLIVEVKAPNVAVNEDDIRQALSYARMHEPIVPLVLVTNGVNAQLRRTYDGIEMKTSDVAAERLDSVLSAAAALASSQSEEAVRTLLGASSGVWTQVLTAWTEETVAAMTGNVEDFRYPIAREFTIPRAIVEQLHEQLTGKTRVLVLHGPPLSGVTNVLAQFACTRSDGPALFVDGKVDLDTLQFIANRLSRELSFGVSKDDVRSWFNTRKGLLDVTLVIDGLPPTGIDELIEGANAGLFRLVIGMDSEIYRRSSVVSGRIQQSLLGRSAVATTLFPLSDKEFDDALEVLRKSFGTMFFNGAQHVPDLRWPRTLRVLAGTLPKKATPFIRTDHCETCLILLPIPGPMTLEACSRAFASDPELTFDLQRLVVTFLQDVSTHIADPAWLIATWGQPSVDPDALEQALGERRIQRLRKQGFLSWIETQTLGPRFLIRIEELLAHYVAEKWSIDLGSLLDRNAVVSELGRLIHQSKAIPTGDVVLAAAIFRAARKNPRILSMAIPYLMEQKPTVSRIGEGARLCLLVKDGPIRLHFGEGMNEEVTGNLQPWLVLSHLASWPMAVDNAELSANFSIFTELGTYQGLLAEPRPTRLADVPGFHFHDIEGIGSVLCLNTGIVEPLLQSMLNHAHSYPDELVSLAKFALNEKELHLAWRVLTVATAAATSADRRVQHAAVSVAEVLRDWWGDILTKTFE